MCSKDHKKTAVLARPPYSRIVKGTVVEFDEVVGLGQIRSDGGQPYPFHCTQIADGSRIIEAGTPVEFRVTAGHLGRWEASAISPAG